MNSSFRFPNNKVVDFQLPDSTSEMSSTYLVGIKKGGSTMFAHIMRDLAPYSEKTVFEFSKEAFSKGLAPNAAVEDIDGAFRRPGYVYGVFRWLPENDLLNLSQFEKHTSNLQASFLSLIRDPRDVMVSLYFSDAKSHPLRKSKSASTHMLKRREEIQKLELDDYVLERASGILRSYLRTTQLLALENSTILRYEDIIYDKEALVRAVAEAMSAEVGQDDIKRIADKNDKLPSEERESSHVRQVHPENYKKKLKPETIEELNDMFKVVLNSFSYSY